METDSVANSAISSSRVAHISGGGMRRIWWITAVVALLAAPQRPLSAQAPVGATGVCKDSTYTFSTVHRGACSRHHGVSRWLAPTASKTDSEPPTPKGHTQPARTGVTVWVNTPTMVYHCRGDRWYGATKRGKYMTEGQAKAAGARPAYGRACS